MGRVVVIGGGAAGLMAAYAAGSQGAQVTLLERNEKLGKKIYITGKGRCNLTNDCPPDEFLENVVRGEKFLTGALWSFSPEDMMSLCGASLFPSKWSAETASFPYPITQATLQKCWKEPVFPWESPSNCRNM